MFLLIPTLYTWMYCNGKNCGYLDSNLDCKVSSQARCSLSRAGQHIDFMLWHIIYFVLIAHSYRALHSLHYLSLYGGNVLIARFIFSEIGRTFFFPARLNCRLRQCNGKNCGYLDSNLDCKVSSQARCSLSRAGQHIDFMLWHIIYFVLIAHSYRALHSLQYNDWKPTVSITNELDKLISLNLELQLLVSSRH